MKINEILNKSIKRLTEVGIESSDFEAKELLAFVLNIPRNSILFENNRELTKKERQQYKNLISSRENHEPLQLLIGHTDFMGSKILCEKGVLIPRFDTESVVEAAIEKVIDIENDRSGFRKTENE
ncbi:MAG: hypothetical protein ACRCUS_06430, partial [Anaerovoracaceae bacterium]